MSDNKFKLEPRHDGGYTLYENQGRKDGDDNILWQYVDYVRSERHARKVIKNLNRDVVYL